MTKREFVRLLKKHGIKNESFAEEAWTRMGGFSDVLKKEELEPMIELFLSRISKKRRSQLSRPE